MSNSYNPNSFWEARRAFFEGNDHGTTEISEAVLRSWRRCHSQGLNAQDSVDFISMGRGALSALSETNRHLIDVARPELASLARSVASVGYAVLLTDAAGQVLAVDGPIDDHGAALRYAFRPGIDLSENCVGTSAMSLALTESHPFRVRGGEHFFSDVQIFQCSAAPVFSPQGEVIGAVDVSHDMPGMLDSALWLAERCAMRIERRLFQTVPAFLMLEIDVDEGENASGSLETQAWLALGRDGEILAASRSARRLMSWPGAGSAQGFDTVFNDRFEPWMSAWQQSRSGCPLQLRNGIQLRARSMAGAPAPSRAAMPAPTRRPAEVSPAQENDSATPVFGDPALDTNFLQARRVFGAGLPVLITGETGCGKEISARALHLSGPRPDGPFIALNCASISGELIAGELFGHVEGAYTGAKRGGAPGKFEAAHGGTLFLDEIGDMPAHLQATLLRVLDGKEVVRVGDHRVRPVDVMILAATNRNLTDAIANGTFRDDLYYRLAGYELHLTPLRERQDFDGIVDHLLAQHGVAPERIGPATRRQLRGFEWPGNLRQLAQSLRRALTLAAPSEPLESRHFSFPGPMTARPRAGAEPGPPLLIKQLTLKLIQDTLQRCDGNVTLAAQQLGMGRATLYRRLNELRGNA